MDPRFWKGERGNVAGLSMKVRILIFTFFVGEKGGHTPPPHSESVPAVDGLTLSNTNMVSACFC